MEDELRFTIREWGRAVAVGFFLVAFHRRIA